MKYDPPTRDECTTDASPLPSPRASVTRIDAGQIQDEESIEWLAPVDQLPAYVRESLMCCGRAVGRPKAIPGARIVGWANLSPHTGYRAGYWVRRVFWLSTTSDPYPHGINAPAEAVDPLTIATKQPGTLTARCTPCRHDPPGPVVPGTRA